MLSDPIQSTPAALQMRATDPNDVAALSLAGGSNGLNLLDKNPEAALADRIKYTRDDLRDLLQMSVDGSDFVSIGLEHLVGLRVSISYRDRRLPMSLLRSSRRGLVTVKSSM